MIALYRRHLSSCPHGHEGRSYRRCSCPIHVDGTLAGKPIKPHSLKTSNWTLATATVHEWEARGYIEEPDNAGRLSMRDAITDFIGWLRENRGTKAQTIYLYECAFMEGRHKDKRRMKKLLTLEAYCNEAGIRYAEQVKLTDLEALQRRWENATPLTRYNYTVRLKTLFAYLDKRKKISSDPAADLVLPDTSEREETRPFSREQMLAIIQQAQRSGPDDYALVLMLRYSGLRILDAVMRPCAHLRDTQLTLRQMKTGGYVTALLPGLAVQALADCPRMAPGYWFWDGAIRDKTPIGIIKLHKYLRNKWGKRLKRIFTDAGIPEGHPHMLRDTFAVENILGEMSVKQVSTLLGHSSIRTTEKHYLPWIAQMQRQMEVEQRRVHGADPVLQMLSQNEPYVAATRKSGTPVIA